MTQHTYIEQVIEAWEANYKKGLLTFWILAALADGDKHMQQISQFISVTYDTNLTADDKSLYRSLSRFRKMQLIEPCEMPSKNAGPAHNMYRLTSIGAEALRQFTEKNITDVFLTNNFRALLERINK